MASDVLSVADRLWNGELSTSTFHPVEHVGGFVEITDGVGFCPSFANVSSFRTDDGLVLVDTGSAPLAQIGPSQVPNTKLQPYSSHQLLNGANDGPLVVAAGLQDPGNLGTILRSAEAFGAAGVFLTEGTVSPYNSKVLRGSAGSIPGFRVSSDRGECLAPTSSATRSALPR